jgi:hypothetical protein
MAQFRAFPFFIKSAAMKYFNKHCNRSEVKKLWNKTFQLYKSFVDEAPDIGGKENNMSNNLYMALAIFAFYEAVDKKVTCEELRQMMTEYMPKNIPVISALLDFNKPKNQEKLKRRFEKYKSLSDKKLDNGEWGNSWRVEMLPDNKKGVAFNLVGCPLADFAKKHGYLEIMSVLCDFDYITASLMHARLIRKHTVADGSQYCDFLYIGDKESEE